MAPKYYGRNYLSIIEIIRLIKIFYTRKVRFIFCWKKIEEIVLVGESGPSSFFCRSC